MGNGTYSENIAELIKKMELKHLLVVVDESGSTEKAEKLYFAENPPGGIKKLLGLFLSWRPSQPVDDYAAYILAKEYLSNSNHKNI